jgi:hypothetical protein
VLSPEGERGSLAASEEVGQHLQLGHQEDAGQAVPNTGGRAEGSCAVGGACLAKEYIEERYGHGTGLLYPGLRIRIRIQSGQSILWIRIRNPDSGGQK